MKRPDIKRIKRQAETVLEIHGTAVIGPCGDILKLVAWIERLELRIEQLELALR